MKKKTEGKNRYGGIFVVFKMIAESTIFALSSLKTDKFRTFLSLLGVTIGIFSIVAVFTAVDALQKNINDGLNSFGGDVVFIQQWPMAPEDGVEYKWWEYRQRPAPTLEEFNFIKKNSQHSKYVAFIASFYKVIKYKRNSFTQGDVAAVTPEWNNIYDTELSSGRNFTQLEFNNGLNVAIIGAEVANMLFGQEDPVGKFIKIGGLNTAVIGVYKAQGESMVSVANTDYLVMIPVNYARSFIDLKRRGDMIAAIPNDNVEEAEFLAELKSLMRGVRRLTPSQKDNFSINQMTFIFNAMGEIFKVINIVGWVIGGFSLLIGGFGIANIMFVSVKERTNQIGIQKALGAKRYVIMTQFLVEAAVLSILGGLLGILLVYVFSALLKGNTGNFHLILTFGNAIKGLAVAIIIGIVSGIAPAWAAAKLNPVEAINS